MDYCNTLMRQAAVSPVCSQVAYRSEPPVAIVRSDSQLFAAISRIDHATAETTMAAALSAGFPGVMPIASRDCVLGRNTQPICTTTDFS